MSKERANLDALEEHCGTAYAQALAVPDPLFESLRSVFGIVPFVLMPPVEGEEAIVVLADFHGALKGLPPNERANMLCAAAGTPYKVRGDVFIGKVRVEASGGVVLGTDAPPAMIMERDWLETAQSANKAAVQLSAASPASSGPPPPGWKPPAASEAAQLSALLAAYGAAAVAQAQAMAADAAAGEAADALPSEPAAATEEDAPIISLMDLEEPDKLMGVLVFDDASVQGGTTSDSITVTVRVPAKTKSRDVQCEITDGRLQLHVGTLPAGKRMVVDGELFQAVTDHSWNLEDDTGERLLTLELEKEIGVAGHVRWLMLTR